MKKYLLSTFIAIPCFAMANHGGIKFDIDLMKIESSQVPDTYIDLTNDAIDWALFYEDKSVYKSNANNISDLYLIGGAEYNCSKDKSHCASSYLSRFDYGYVNNHGEALLTSEELYKNNISVGRDVRLYRDGDGLGFTVSPPQAGQYLLTMFQHSWFASAIIEVCINDNCKEQFLKQSLGKFASNKAEVTFETTNEEQVVTFKLKRETRQYDWSGKHQWQVLEAIKLEELL